MESKHTPGKLAPSLAGCSLPLFPFPSLPSLLSLLACLCRVFALCVCLFSVSHDQRSLRIPTMGQMVQETEGGLEARTEWQQRHARKLTFSDKNSNKYKEIGELRRSPIPQRLKLAGHQSRILSLLPSSLLPSSLFFFCFLSVFSGRADGSGENGS